LAYRLDLMGMPAARTRAGQVEVMNGFGDAGGGVARILCVLGYFLEEIIERTFGGVAAFHVHELFPGRLAPDAGRGGISDGAVLGRKVRNGAITGASRGP
jgi:hypothetical protein